MISSTVLFGTLLWSKFAHMFFKPAAAFQRRVAEADGSRDNQPPPADKPWGKATQRLAELPVPDVKELNSQLLCHEPDALNIDTGLPVISKDKFKQGVYY